MIIFIYYTLFVYKMEKFKIFSLFRLFLLFPNNML